MPLPVDLQFIKEAEAKLGVIFPTSFKLRMSKSNGGGVRTKLGTWEESWELHPIFDISDTTRLKRTCNDIMREIIYNRQAWRLASTAAGNVLLFLPDPDDPQRLQDAVFWWDHETSELKLVADDFGECG